MLQCGHIVCLDCILKEEMTYSSCKLCLKGDIGIVETIEEKPESVRIISEKQFNIFNGDNGVEFIDKSIVKFS